MSSLFSISVGDLSNLGPEKSVDFFRRLLWAEATKYGIAKSLINVSSNIYASDGGVDAQVKDINIPTSSRLIKSGLTRYQIKSGDYKLDNSGIRKLFFKKIKKRRELKPRIKYCLDNNGTFVVVLFEQSDDNPDKNDVNTLEKKIRNVLSEVDVKYRSAKIEVLMPNTLASYFNSFPSLCLSIRGLDIDPFWSHESWANIATMKHEIMIGQKMSSKLEEYRRKLRDTDGPLHIRITGEPGIGKTRMALELTKDDDLSSIVIYSDSPDKVKTGLAGLIALKDSDHNVILVVDECNGMMARELWNILSTKGARIKLITIYNEPEEMSGTTEFVSLEELDDESIGKIIASYGFPNDQVVRWVPYCSGSPRVAHVIGTNLRNNPDDLLKRIDIEEVWERFIAERDMMKTAVFEERKEVLLWLSMFKRFGYETPNGREFDLLSKKIQKQTKLSDSQIRDIIEKMKERKVLQGRTTLYITPKLLHLRIWTWWWKKYGRSPEADPRNFLVADPTTNPPLCFDEQMEDWYYEMFRYARQSEDASQVVRDLLGPEGPFQSIDFFNIGIGGRFFSVLSNANPEAALRCLQRTIGRQTKETLLRFTAGRRQIIYALQKIAVQKELFQDAARILLSLAEAENEMWSNNASGVFIALFSNAIGKAAPTATPPKERFPVIEEALASTSKEKRILALRACDGGLEAHHFVGLARSTDYGLDKEPEFWMPKTYGERFDAFRLIWRFVYSKLSVLEKEERVFAIEILCKRARGLSAITNLSEMVIDTFEELATNSDVNKKVLLNTIFNILRFEKNNLSVPIIERWKNLKMKIIGSDYHSMMSRYVGMYFLEDTVNDDNSVDPVMPKLEELAQRSVESPDMLKQELNWLTTTAAENGYKFGYELAKRDRDFSLLEVLYEAQRSAKENPTAFFLGGYFLAIFEEKPEKYEMELDNIAGDPVLQKFVPEITWRARTTNRSAKRVLNLIKNGVVHQKNLHMFALGGAIRMLAEDVFQGWIDYLIEQGDSDAMNLALNFCYYYYLRAGIKRELPDEGILEILMHNAFFGISGSEKKDEMIITSGNTGIEFYWTELAKAYVIKYPNKSLKIGSKMLEHLGEDKSVVHSHSESIEVLTMIARIHSLAIWEQASKFLGPPIDRRAFYIGNWLRGNDFSRKGGEGFLHQIPLDKIIAWVEENIEKRARYLARLIPKEPFSMDDKICPREALIRFGGREDFRAELRANFGTEFFSGSESLHYKERKNYLLKLKENETNSNVKLWIDEYLDIIDKQIKRAENEEERQEF